MAGRAADRGACAFVANVTLATLRIYKFRPKISLTHLYMFEYPQIQTAILVQSGWLGIIFCMDENSGGKICT